MSSNMVIFSKEVDMKKKELGEVMTVMQAAEEAGVVRQTIYEWMKSGFLGYEQLGHVRLIRKDALHAAADAKVRRNKAKNYLRKKDKKG